MNEKDLSCKKDCPYDLKCFLRDMCHKRIQNEIQSTGYVGVKKGSQVVSVVRDGYEIGQVSDGHFTPVL